MICDNNATIKRRELLTQIAKLCLDQSLQAEIDDLPLKRFPKNSQTTRCCVHAARAIVRQRLIAMMGFSVEQDDEKKALSAYAQDALKRDKVEGTILTVIDNGCSACVQANYFVTNTCRGCLARPCSMNCPKDAISFVNGQALIDSKACVNCGRCQKVCPYHAIVYVPIPCEEACPVGAIMKDETGKEYIDYNKCIYCGKCSRACPFGAIMEKSQIIDIIQQLKTKNPVIAMIAPAIIGQFGGKLNQLVSALLKLGFSEVVEVARGAEITVAKEAEEFIERISQGDQFMTTSCCPAYTEVVRKHIPGLKKHVSDTKTPLHYTGEMVRNNNPEAITVFLSPCFAKRKEAIFDDYVDFVLTFEELGALFIAADIDVLDCAETPLDVEAKISGRRFPVVGGVAKSVKQAIGDRVQCNEVIINGVTKKELNLLKAYARGSAPGNLVEVMACEGGCIAGPGVISHPKVSKGKIDAMEKE
ncbi:MAG: monomeric [FeFe] hydrogenase [Candidatus Omnitrophica bacterium]|nr:monomeric [FeFe] hydrogenase [Candidatus Omnitrophota bacterium]